MHQLSQFAALELLHQQLAREGGSPALWEALIRGYAQLGLLTETFYHPAHNGFKARAFLYAQRWCALQPDSAQARYSRAYAFALCGLHAAALAELEQAAKLAQQGDTVPDWVAAVRALCECDWAALERMSDEEKAPELTRLLLMVAAEQASSQDLTSRLAVKVFERMPECFRVSDAVCRIAGVRLGHTITTAPMYTAAIGIYQRLGPVPNLPPEVLQIAAERTRAARQIGGPDDYLETEFVQRRALIDSLRRHASDATAQDRGSALSLATLALLIEEPSFRQVFERVRFLRHSLGVDPDEFIEHTEVLVQGHPFAAMIRCMAKDRETADRANDEMARAVATRNLEWHENLPVRIRSPLPQPTTSRDDTARQLHPLVASSAPPQMRLPAARRSRICIRPPSIWIQATGGAGPVGPCCCSGSGRV
jgi:tetratricopeptide (TPR) repeat protein